jgi:hypothetical protein
MAWDDYADAFRRLGDLTALLEDPDDPVLLAAAHRLIFLSLSSGYMTTFADPDRPDFVPSVSVIHNAVGTNPDFIYYHAAVDGAGQYRITGNRGDGLFLLMDMAAGGLGAMDELGPSLALIDFDMLDIEVDGEINLLLSGERPDDWTGQWHWLDPAAKTLAVRQASYDWGAGSDARLSIERLDRPVAATKLTPEETSQRLSRLVSHPERFAGLALKFMAAQRAKGHYNRFEHDDWAGRGGVAGQHYYQGLFRLEPGHVLILETALPETVRYWNVQLSDPLWNSIDWLNHQNSLNCGQARIDSDGKFRAVIALDDPHVANWLDPGGWHEGSMMLRWTEASSGPAPTLTSVPMSKLRDHLPVDTLIVTANERDTALRARRRAVQLRRRW